MPWTPPYSPAFWLDPNASSAEHNAYIATLPEVIAGNHAIQTTVASRPRLKKNLLNGLSSVRFRSGKSMAGPLGLTLNTLFIVLEKHVRPASVPDPFALVVGGTAERCFCHFNGNIYDGSTDYFGTAASNTWRDGVDTDALAADGTTTTYGQRFDTAQTRVAATYKLGDGGVPAGGQYFEGDVFAVIGYTQKLSDVELADVFTQIEAHFAVSAGTLEYTIVDGTNGSGDAYRMWVPVIRPQSAAVIYSHGLGETRLAPFAGADAKYITISPRILDDGLILASADFHGNDFGGAASRVDMADLRTLLTGTYGITKVINWGQSAGGPLAIWGAVNLAECVGFYGIFPIQDQAFTLALPPYNIAVGFDPISVPAASFDGLPMRWTHSYADTIVPRAENTDAMSARVAGHAFENGIVTSIGEHGHSSNYDGDDFSAFLFRAFSRAEISGPATGVAGTPSSAFTVSVTSGVFFSGTDTITLTASDGTITVTAAGGSVSGNGTGGPVVTPANSAFNFTFTFTAASAGVKTITLTNGQGWPNPASVDYLSTAAPNPVGARAMERLTKPQRDVLMIAALS